MRVLLDTHAFLWWVEDDRRLSTPARRVIADEATRVILSVVSAWEMTIKTGLKRLDAPDDIGAAIDRCVETVRLEVLPIELAHALDVRDLPNHHHDPFDRLLVAQARTESLALISADAILDAYGIERIW